MRCSIGWLTIAFLSWAPQACVQANEIPPRAEATAADASRVAREEERLVIAALNRKINLECDETQLDEAIRQVAKLIDREILIDMVSFNDEGISTDQPVTLRLGEMTARQTLHFLLKPLSLTWVANDGVLEITTAAKADQTLVTRVYDVRKLCESLEPFTKEVLLQLHRPKPAPPGMMGGGGGFFSVPAVPLVDAAFGQFGGGVGMPGVQNARINPPVSSVEAILARMIIECSQLTWEVDSGEGGTIQLGKGCLIISQSYQGQFQIAGILDALQRLVDGKVKGHSVVAHRSGYPRDEDDDIFTKLAAIKTIEIEDQSLEAAMAQFSKEHGIRIWIDTHSLSDEGISTESTVGPRRRMQKLPLGICLKKILQTLNLIAVVDEGVLVVTTPGNAAQMLTTQIYDIAGINRIGNHNPNETIVMVLSKAVRGSWKDLEGEGGAAQLISSKHLAVLQTQEAHTDLALLMDELSREELQVPVDPPLELRVYTAPDAETARDLVRTLPQLVEKNWAARGGIRQAGSSLFINQTEVVHDELDGLFEKLEQSWQRRHGAGKDSAEVKASGHDEDALKLPEKE